MKQVAEKRKKVVQNLQDLIIACKRNGQVFNQHTVAFATSGFGQTCDNCRCDGRNLPKP